MLKKPIRFKLKTQIILIILIVYVFIIGAFYLFVQAAIKQTKEQAAAVLMDSLDIYLSSIRLEFNACDSFLFSEEWELYADQPIERMEPAGNDFLQSAPHISQLIFYDSSRDYFRCLQAGGSGVSASAQDERTAAESYHNQIKDLLRDNPNINLGWDSYQIGSEWKLIRIRQQGVQYCLAVVDLAALGRSAQADFGMKTTVVISEDGVPYNEAIWLKGYGFHYSDISKETVLWRSGNQQYMAVSRPFLNMRTTYAIPYESIFWFRQTLVIITILIFLSVFAAALAFRRSIFMPMKEMQSVILKITDGEMPDSMEPYSSPEFARINQTFDHMVRTINTMKIEQYEHEIRNRELEMDTLRMQIQPHFYLNCLKSLYGLSKQNKNQEAQAAIIGLSDHLRYCFTTTDVQVELRKELKMCENYLIVSGLGREYPPQLKMSVPSSLMQLAVPPVSILTLVENCLKHTDQVNKPIIVHLSASRYERKKETLVSLSVSDNGRGFSDELLEKLNREDFTSLGQESTGLRNVIRRFDLMYDKSFSYAFYNQSGAVVEIILSFPQEG